MFLRQTTVRSKGKQEAQSSRSDDTAAATLAQRVAGVTDSVCARNDVLPVTVVSPAPDGSGTYTHDVVGRSDPVITTASNGGSNASMMLPVTDHLFHGTVGVVCSGLTVGYSGCATVHCITTMARHCHCERGPCAVIGGAGATVAMGQLLPLLIVNTERCH